MFQEPGVRNYLCRQCSTTLAFTDQLVSNEGKKEGIWNKSMNGPHIVVPTMNDTHSMAPPTPVSARIEKCSNLERLEASLGHARAAIREADHHTLKTLTTPLLGLFIGMPLPFTGKPIFNIACKS